MTELPDTVKEYSEYAAEKFLQTAVFVDDKIYAQGGGSFYGSKDTISRDARKKASKATTNISQGAEESIVGGQTDDDELDDDELDEYFPHDIVTSFAEKQIICSLFQPTEGIETSQESNIFKLCLAADIVIVDWDIYTDQGDMAKELIYGLIRQAACEAPGQLRLILVYTKEQGLSGITSELYSGAKRDDDLLKPVQKKGDFAFHTKNSRVSILGKTRFGRLMTSSYPVVEEKELANVAVKEFAKLASGLLHAATLLGLAEIKKNSRKVLSKFNAKLDPAFLTHRAMCLPGDDASSHIVPLLVSEIESVLEDVLPEPLITDSLIRDWCQHVWEPGDHTEYLLSEDGIDSRAMIGESICLNGYKKTREQFNTVPKLSNNSNTRKAAKILLPEEDDKSNHLFSRLMASRTFYGNDKPKTLSLGSIVYCPEDKKYLLCIQPVCDSVRLKEDRVFVFVELQCADSSAKEETSHIVVKDGDELVELLYQPKSYYCRVETFAPNLETERVQSDKFPEGKIGFYNKSRCRHYYWIDQLKTAHAQRAGEKLARDLSRVGLTESEWSRGLAK